MVNKKILENIEKNPIILAVKNSGELDFALREEPDIIFLLGGDILTIAKDVEKIKNAKKIAIVHIDLIDGLSSKEISVDFIKKYTKADGIITTKPKNIKRAKELSLFSILRIFLIDSMALENLERNILISNPDMVEVLPGVLPKVLVEISRKIKTPIIAGGMIRDKEDALNALKSGATAISSSNKEVWKL